MKTKVKICFALFPLFLVLVLSFRSGFSLNDTFNQIFNFCSSDVNRFGFLEGCIHSLLNNYFGIGYNISAVFSWYFSYIIFVSIGFLIYDLFLWFGSFVKTFKG